MKQLPTDCFNKRMIRLLSSDAWAALTAGISTVPIEVVSAEGKRSKVTAVRFAVRGTDKADSFLKVFEMEEIEAA